MRPNPVTRLLGYVMFLLMSGFETQVDADITCGQSTDLQLNAVFKYKDSIYAFYEDMTAKVIGFRNGLPVLEVNNPVKAKTLWPELDVKPSTVTISGALANGSSLCFFINTNNRQKNVQIFEDFKHLKTVVTVLVFHYFEANDEKVFFSWSLRQIISSGVLRNQANETFIILLAYQTKYMHPLKPKTSRHYVEQIYLYNDLRKDPKLVVELPKTVETMSKSKAYLFTPNALLFLGFHGKTNQLMIFYGSIWSPTDFSMDEGKKYFDFDPKVDYKLSSHWMGCPQVFCWEADVDAVTKLKDGSLLIFRGAYVWTLKQWPPISLHSYPQKIVGRWPQIGGHLDAAFTVKGETYLFKDTKVYKIVSDVVKKEKITQKMFKNSPDGGLDAASLYQHDSADNIVYLFQGFYIWEYSMTGVNNVQAVFRRKQKLTLFKGLPKNIDGAYSPGAQFLVAFKGSFYYEAKADAISRPILSQKQAICGDAFYSTISGKIQGLLGITSFDKFSAYRLQFIPIALNDSLVPPEPSPSTTSRETTISTITETESTASSDTPKTGSTGYLLYLLLAIVLMVLVLGVALFIFINCRKGKKSGPSAVSAINSPSSRSETSALLETSQFSTSHNQSQSQRQ